MIRKKWRTEVPPDRAELARLLPPPGDPHLSLDRTRLLEEHLLNEIQHHSPAPSAAPSRPVRRALFITVPVAAALTAAAVLLTVPGANDPASPAPVAAPTVRIENGSTAQLASTVRQMSAAAAARATPEPKPGQFVYVKRQVSYLSMSHNADTSESRTWVQPLHTREVWKSPDDKQGWLDEPGYQPEGGITLDRDAPEANPQGGQDIPGQAPDRSYHWVKALPTNPAALLKKIYAEVAPSGGDQHQRAFDEIESIIGEQIVPARTAAALYQAAARIPGVVLVAHSQDAAGRSGIALARVDERAGERAELVFDRTTYAYLGSRGVQVREVDGIKPGTVTERTAVLERAVVDQKKDRPDTRGTA
ncbi:CU044_5270 family protein [Streptomyces sp. NPDC021093]|uniref:CU044_5270 family protein n=1 Tax=Streptomyces sp. NPDC021093 TaxID=3365112 RepID=UPI0037B586EC